MSTACDQDDDDEVDGGGGSGGYEIVTVDDAARAVAATVSEWVETILLVPEGTCLATAPPDAVRKLIGRRGHRRRGLLRVSCGVLAGSVRVLRVALLVRRAIGIVTVAAPLILAAA